MRLRGTSPAYWSTGNKTEFPLGSDETRAMKRRVRSQGVGRRSRERIVEGKTVSSTGKFGTLFPSVTFTLFYFIRKDPLTTGRMTVRDLGWVSS